MALPMSNYLLEGRNLTRTYNGAHGFWANKLRKNPPVHALKGVSFAVEPGKTLAVVGESGCGKSTLARIITMIDAQTSGELLFAGEPIDIQKTNVAPALRQQVQIVFQNPYGSLNPRQKVGSTLEEPLLLNSKKNKIERRQMAMAMLEKVGLSAEHYHRYPHMFSGGQRQRIAIARSLMLTPQLLVLDEPVSALDLSVQAQVLKLLADLQQEFNLTYLFISHDLSVVKHIADDILVMHQGEVVEQGASSQLFNAPQHEYTQKLFAATPVIDVGQIRQRIAQKHAQ